MVRSTGCGQPPTTQPVSVFGSHLTSAALVSKTRTTENRTTTEPPRTRNMELLQILIMSEVPILSGSCVATESSEPVRLRNYSKLRWLKVIKVNLRPYYRNQDKMRRSLHKPSQTHMETIPPEILGFSV